LRNESSDLSDDPISPVRANGALWFLAHLLPRVAPYKKTAALVGLTIAVSVAYESLFPLSIKFLIDDAIVPHDGHRLVLILSGLATLMAVWAVCGTAHDLLFARLSASVLNDLRKEMYVHLQQLSMNFYSRTPAANILARFSTDLAAVENTVVMALPYALLSLGCAGSATVVMFVLDWRIALLASLGIPLCVVGPRLIGPRAADAGYRMKSMQAGVSGMVEEHVLAQPVVKAFGLQPLLSAQFREHLGGLLRVSVSANFLSYLLERTPQITIMVFNLAIISVGGYLAFDGRMSVGSLVAIQTIFMSLSQSVAGLAWALPQLVQASAGMQRIEELLAEQPQVTDAPDAVSTPSAAGALGLQDVSFGYGDARNLDGVSLAIPAGASVAFVGPSGSGKSTALNLILRFYDPSAGRVTIDGLDLRSITQSSLRALMGVVFQESFLFNTSIRDNIRITKPGATDAEVERAAKFAEIHDTIMAMPQGYDTQVGERGGRLSGGQRQRIAIARALLRDPTLLILDEATSALDSATEYAINATLQRVARGRTVVSVTHRLTSVTSMDCIFVLVRGRLVERGTHAELLALGGAYRELWERQSGLSLSADGDTAAVEESRLRKVPILDQLDGPLLQQVAHRFVTEHYPEDRLVVQQGDPADRFYIVVRGTLEVLLNTEGGAARRIRALRDGDHFGDIALLRNEPRTATVRTVTPCVLLSLQRGPFLRLLENSPELRAKLERAAVGLEFGSGAE
jgi:ATP-binding cassette, subfamily B, bacterial